MSHTSNSDHGIQSGFQHGSAAGATATAAQGPSAPGATPIAAAGASVENSGVSSRINQIAITEHENSAMDGTTPQRAFLSNESSPAQGRRSPFGEFGARTPPSQAPPPRGRHASRYGRPASRSRSSHSRARLPVDETIRKLQDTIDAMEKQHTNDRKWLADNARRIDKFESQVREQTLEAKNYARAKCDEMDVRLRAELDEKVPKLVVASMPDMMPNIDAKLLGSLTAHETKVNNAVESRCKVVDKFAERIDDLETTVRTHIQMTEQHQEYLKGMINAKPGEEKTLLSYFKYLEVEIAKANKSDTIKDQKTIDEIKRMMQDFETHLTKNLDEKLSHVAAVTAQQLDHSDDRIKVIERELSFIKATAAADPMAPLRAPPGYSVAADPMAPHRAQPGYSAAGLNLRGAFQGGCGGDGHRDHEGCGRGEGRPGACGPGQGGFPVGGGLAGGAKADASGCHCHHVDTLMAESRTMHTRLNQHQGWLDGLLRGPGRGDVQGSRVPSHGGHGGPTHDSAHDDAPAGRSPPRAFESQSRLRLPLVLGPIGALTTGRAFDDRISLQDEFKFNGSKGDVWKGKIERYFFSRVPAIHELFNWAEKEDGPISDERLDEAVGDGLTKFERDGTSTNHLNSLDCAIWGFLSNAVSGEAETILKQAGTLKGVEAWRRIVRFIDHGRDIRLEIMRNKMRHLRAKTIKTLEGVTIGIAEFENTIAEFVSAGGVQPSDAELKSDLNAILPRDLSESLAMKLTDGQQTYQGFRDFIKNQTAVILLNRNRSALHALTDDKNDRSEAGGDDDAPDDDDGGEGGLVAQLLNVLNANVRGRTTKGRFQSAKRTPSAPRRPAPRDGAPQEQKCPNCHGNHSKADCKKPAVDLADRTCFTCGEKGHASRQCPKRPGGQRPGPLKALSDSVANLRVFAVNDPCERVDHNGFQRVGKATGCHPKTFPKARQVTLGDFIDQNVFSGNSFRALSCTDADEPTDRKTKHRLTQPTRVGVRGALVAPSDELPSETPRAKTHTVRDFEAKAKIDSQAIRRSLEEVEALLQQELIGPISLIEDEADAGAGEVLALHHETKVRVAMDSGACKSVIHPSAVPAGIKIAPNTTGKHFSGAGGEVIERFGECETLMTSSDSSVRGRWSLADVARPLTSVSQVTGPADGEGNQDVLFNNKVCVVVPPGVVAAVLRQIKPIAQYRREGGLYLADFTLSDFVRQGPQA